VILLPLLPEILVSFIHLAPPEAGRRTPDFWAPCHGKNPEARIRDKSHLVVCSVRDLRRLQSLREIGMVWPVVHESTT